MQPSEPELLRRRVLAALRVLYDAIQAGSLEPVVMSIDTQTDAATGAPTGQQTLTLTTRPRVDE